ncbi:hypothetical protein VST7929_02109 [Vibrio stylophorae]|uniref:DUF1904 domain-containing protein n=1 Tax=Vibrio stylophorae TaxID=659351 RepID=A0ABM8ZV44_9VIBR|nr:DUF1904 domain-containing protein [Vibrio stylophorae]CAH0534201.1 hypothetical protein VST7929_02109 [Vibrio stylophorae]
MPHLRFRGIEADTLQTISTDLVDALVPLMNSPRLDFTLEQVHSTFVFDGEVHGNRYPFVELFWFDRGQDVQDKVAQLITEHLRAALPAVDNIAVIFYPLTPAGYYDNGQHY